MTGLALRNWVLVIVGNIFVIILAVRAVGYYARRDWGDMTAHLVAAVVVAGVIFFPDQVITLLKNSWTMFTTG
ncbi:hypothetical protein [Nostocoides vanveenii]|uniref:Uncharacterized protein n=1 Tax=Nostocoides vanveenii TaxID=330835 RepID=A0ABN2K173_9MICO